MSWMTYRHTITRDMGLVRKNEIRNCFPDLFTAVDLVLNSHLSVHTRHGEALRATALPGAGASYHPRDRRSPGSVPGRARTARFQRQPPACSLAPHLSATSSPPLSLGPGCRPPLPSLDPCCTRPPSWRGTFLPHAVACVCSQAAPL